MPPRVVPAPAYPVRMPARAVTGEMRNEFRFMLYGGMAPQDKLWRQWDEGGRYCRRRGTRSSPLAFAYVYLTGAMKPMRTDDGEIYSFSEFHVALCDEAKHWMKPDGRRTGLIAPRGSGKSFWTYFALPLWAIAHGHRKFFAGWSHSNKQAVERLDDLRRELQQNELLQYDFPELAVPKGARNNSHLVGLASGRAFASHGLDAVALGLRYGTERPGIKVIDDGETNESNYAVDGKDKRLKTIRDIVLPMNADAAVVLSGTVVMPGSIGHDLVKAALDEPTEEWVAQERFTDPEGHKPLYFNAILDEGTPDERSIWPEWRSLGWLRTERKENPAQYALHYANQPTTRGGRYWQQEDFRYNPRFPRDQFLMWVDPAVVNKAGRDKTAVVVIGSDVARSSAVVEFFFQGHITKVDLGRRIVEYKRARPDVALLDVYIEKNNGGEMYAEIIQPIVQGTGVRLHLVHSGRDVSATGERGKRARIERGYAYYQANKVWHARPFPELEALLTAYPNVRNDDGPDCLAGGLHQALRPA